MSNNVIPSTSICADCGEQRGDHSGGSFLCPDPTALAENRFAFTASEFAHADV